ncbi:phasin family protein [Microvirga antarctica]|uniref:phasin family protein n=1 Tax=Microvirga antarctica TaxID=2819233 RepID=UPI001B308771|nr:phasin family protein [Microvirga antarctica]
MVVMKKAGPKGPVKAPAAVKDAAALVKPKVKATKPVAQRAAEQRVPEPTVVSTPSPLAAPAKVAAPAELPKVVPAQVTAPAPAVVAASPSVPVAAAVETIAAAVAPKGAVLRQAVSEAVSASAQGALAVNDKILDALHSQGHAALDLWRDAIATPHLPDAIRLHSTSARQAYETASAQWRDIAETTAHWFGKAVEPLNSAIGERKR